MDNFERKKIIFYAPLGKNTPPEKIGGAEVGCLKTKAIYEQANIEVVTIHKPAKSKGLLSFAIEMLITPIKLLMTVRREGPKVPVHIVGFYKKNAKFERLLMNIAHFCGNKVIYELRNGSMIATYQNGSSSYRLVLKDLLLKPEIVLCQGLEYVNFIEKKWGVKRSFYPNYIMDDFVKPINKERPKPLKLIYFGRITESKNVDVSIQILAKLRESGLAASLDIIGGCSDSYMEKLRNSVKENNVENYVNFFGRKPFDFIASKLEFAHYFLFPSVEKEEGHSNSLTEAMGFGVVPLVSDAGFNSSICGINELVILQIDAGLYANKIIEIENKGLWEYYSERCFEHISNNYTQKIVSERLLKEVEALYG